MGQSLLHTWLSLHLAPYRDHVHVRHLAGLGDFLPDLVQRALDRLGRQQARHGGQRLRGDVFKGPGVPMPHFDLRTLQGPFMQFCSLLLDTLILGRFDVARQVENRPLENLAQPLQLAGLLGLGQALGHVLVEVLPLPAGLAGAALDGRGSRSEVLGRLAVDALGFKGAMVDARLVAMLA